MNNIDALARPYVYENIESMHGILQGEESGGF